MIPVLAIVGRPNVGKSTLFNCLTRSRAALVADIPGMTRDRQYGRGQFNNRTFIAIDTGGMAGEVGLSQLVMQQALKAIQEADAVLFVVDGKAGLSSADHTIADELRKQSKPIFLVVNKADTLDADYAKSDFYRLGFSKVFAVSAVQQRGIHELIENILNAIAPPQQKIIAQDSEQQGIKVAVIGRPNVGKSTLINRMLGEDRMLVSDSPGTTRDSIFTPFQRHGKNYTLIDTAGIRRRSRVTETVEKFSIVKSLQTMEEADVVVAVLDATSSVSDQDLRLLGMTIEAGRALVVAINKWDELATKKRKEARREFKYQLELVKFARLHFISALHGTGVGDLFKSIQEAYQSATKPIATNRLTTLLQQAVSQHAPSVTGLGRRVKLRYAHLGGRKPPLIVIHGNQTAALPESYQRYLINFFHAHLKLKGTPLCLELKSGENPFAGKKNKLTPRQVKKKRRLVKHQKNKKK